MSQQTQDPKAQVILDHQFPARARELGPTRAMTRMALNNHGWHSDRVEEIVLAIDEGVGKLMATLKDTGWLDLYTRAVFVEFTLYNANVNLFSYVTMLMELPPVGGAVVAVLVQPFRVYNTIGSMAGVILLCELVVLMVLIGYTIATIVGLKQQRIQYVKNATNVMDIIQICLCYSALSLFASKQMLSGQAIKEVFSAKGKAHVFSTV